MPPVDPEKLVPAALKLGALVVVPAAFVGSFAIALALRALFGRKLPASPWTERARASYPLRLTLAFVSPVCAILASIVSFVLAPHVPGGISRWIIGIATFVAAYMGADLVRFAVERAVHRRAIPISGWLAWKPTATMIFSILVVPTAIGAALVGDRFDAHGWTVIAVVALVSLALGTGAMWLFLWGFGLVRPAPMRLRAAVDRAAGKTGVRPRAVGVIPTFGVPFANAFALPILRRVAFTAEALSVLDDDEVEAVAAHELGHVGEPRSVAFARLLRSLLFVPLVAMRPLLHAFGWIGVAVAAIVVVVLARANAILSRRMEERADAIAHHDGTEGPIYARALERLYERNLVPAVLLGGKRRIHPDLFDRMKTAGVEPAWPKPAAPRVRRALLVAVLLLYVYAPALVFFDHWVGHAVDEGAALRFGREARARLEDGRAGDAYMLYLSAIPLDDRPEFHVGLAWAAATEDLCDEAEDELGYAVEKGAKTSEDAPIDRVERAVAECLARRPPTATFEQDPVSGE